MSQLNFLEWLNTNLPWALLLLLLSLGALAWVLYSYFGNSESSRNLTRNSSSASRRDTELFELETQWNSKRNYSSVYDKSPSGAWFEDERKLCVDFLEKLATPPRHDPYPKEEKKYLEIVKESDSKPFSLWLWLFVFTLLGAEATSMALLVADILNASGTQQQTSILAVAVLVLIMVLTVGVPKFVAYAQRNQFYAYNLYSEAPNGNLSLDGHGNKISESAGLAPDESGNGSDVGIASALRMRRRQGKMVRTILNRAIQAHGSPSHYHKALYFFAIYLIFASLGIYLTRDKIIDQLQKEEAASIRIERDAARAARSGVSPPQSAPSSVQGQDAQDQSDLSQEANEAKAEAQRRGILIFVFLFVGIQVIVFLISVGRGFCSAQGEECYKKITRFIRKHGDMSEAEYAASVASRERDYRMEVTATAQRSLAAWQLGLNTAVTDRSKAKDVPPNIFEKILALVGSASERTFLTFVDSTEGRAYLADMTLGVVGGRSGEAAKRNDGVIGANPPHSAGERSVDAVAPIARELSSAADALVEYIESDSAAAEPAKICAFAELKRMVAEGDVEATCRVRLRNEGEFIPYSTFVKMEKRFRTS